MGKKRSAVTASAVASTTGSKATAAVPKRTVPKAVTATAKDAQCDWKASTITKCEEKRMRSLGLISDNEEDVCFPCSDSRPNPPAGFTVMFSAFLYQGLSLPAHEFLRCLLFSYDIQLWQLTLNSILHLAIFITVCEAFLGIDPHWGLWKKIFFIKRYNGGNGPYVVGGIDFVARKEINYLNFPMKEFIQETGEEPKDDESIGKVEAHVKVVEDSGATGDKEEEKGKEENKTVVTGALTAEHQKALAVELTDTSESSPSDRYDNDADHVLFFGAAPEVSTAQPPKRPSGGFADEDELLFESKISRMEKDLLGVHAMAAVIKKKGELAIEAKKYALNELQKATESLNFIALNLSEENKRVHERVEVLTDLSQPHDVFWINKSKVAVVAKVQDRVQQVHRFFDKCRAGLTMIWKTMFPLNPAPPTLLTLMSNFRNAARVRALVRSQLLAGAEIAFAFVLAQHPSLDL
ncbi:hypothetical protein QYE76_017954 [Lolium multiflorum]|uniref:Transposase (putative) gypsy type domain-containing protein n=1 Tax=Lolium multiflorum TaxID=4521 RepID=A0AAD8QG65_LOLMU|nr:hypothetical protein QYE76_017954 [Lolium multiflorum]